MIGQDRGGQGFVSTEHCCESAIRHSPLLLLYHVFSSFLSSPHLLYSCYLTSPLLPYPTLPYSISITSPHITSLRHHYSQQCWRVVVCKWRGHLSAGSPFTPTLVPLGDRYYATREDRQEHDRDGGSAQYEGDCTLLLSSCVRLHCVILCDVM